MVCPRCGSSNVTAQMVTNTQIVAKHRSLFWWLFIGWWWWPVKWFFFTIPAIIVKIFAPKRQKLVTNHNSVFVCQNCGYYGGGFYDTPIPEPVKPAEDVHKYVHKTFHAAGVTFKNDDGTSRQTILRRMKFKDPPFENGKYETSMQSYEFEGEPAIAIFANGMQIGNIPKDIVPYALEHQNQDLCISAIEVYGGQKLDDGNRANYGAEIYLRYDTSKEVNNEATHSR